MRLISQNRLAKPIILFVKLVAVFLDREGLSLGLSVPIHFESGRRVCMPDFAGCALIPKKSEGGQNYRSLTFIRFTTSILLIALGYSSCSEKNSTTRSAVDPCTQTDFASKNTNQCKQAAQLGVPTLRFDIKDEKIWRVGAPLTIIPASLEANGDDISKCGTTPPLPAGLTISSSLCVISGIPEDAVSGTFEVIAINSLGSSKPESVIIKVEPAEPTLRFDNRPINAQSGSPIKISPQLARANGSAITQCGVKAGTATLPSWAEVDPNTCIISGTPDTVLGTTNFTIIATNDVGKSLDTVVSLSVVAAPPTLIYSSEDNFVGNVGSPMSIAPILLKNNGAIITGCTTKISTNPLPIWANLNSSTCVLSGIPTERLTPTTFTILATNTAGQSMDALVTFSVVDVPVVSFLGTSLAARSLGQAVAITPTTLDPRGADITNCAASPTLPEGLSLSPTLCTISGTPTKVSSATYQIIATNSAGQSNPATIVINIHPPSPSLDYTNQWDIVDGETNTGIVRDWPDIPPSFEIPNYQLFAKHYYELAFASTAHQVNDKEVLKHTRWADSQSFPSLVSLFNFTTIFQASFFEDIRAQNYPHITESLTVFPGIISSALISKTTSETPRRSEVASYVRMMKRYFHPLTLDGKPNAGWFGNSPHKGGGNGGSFWYDLGPNVYAMQLLQLFESSEIEPATIAGQAPEESFDQLCRRMADTLYEMTSFLKQTPTSVPSFDYTAIKIVNGKLRAYDPHCADARPNSAQSLPREKLFCPIDFHPIYPVHCKKPQNHSTDPAPWFCFDHPNAYEPSAAGAFIYIGLAAYERWKDPRHLEMATSAMNFLLEYDRNPVYELVYNHGILGAAKMNQQYGTDYDIKKLMRWAFVRSDKQIDPSDLTTWPNASTNARPDVGVLNEMWWDSYPTYGLWGAKANPGAYDGYAFYMNTVSQAATLAPIAKYYPNYAKMLGKYLLHVASNSKYFFSQYVPDELEDPTTFQALSTRLDSRYMSIPYEGFRKKSTKTSTSINLKGDAVELGWARTDLSAYSGALSGMFASIMIRDSHDTSTGNPIVFWDLNITDLPAEKAYPSYLVYNPTTSQKTVTLKRSDIRAYSGLNYNVSPTIGAWDLVSNQWIFSGAGDITFTLPAGDAKVFSLVPSAHSCSVANGRAICSTGGQFYSVLDYRVP